MYINYITHIYAQGTLWLVARASLSCAELPSTLLDESLLMEATTVQTQLFGSASKV